MSKEIYLYSEDKKYKCAVELADSCDSFGCPDHSMIILTEERPNGTYVIAQAKDRILETEKDKQIADLQHQLEVAEKALELACNEELRSFGEYDEDYGYEKQFQMLKEQYKEQAENEVKGE